VLQPAEQIGGSLVAYGLGDFLGTALPRAPWPARLGAVLAIDVSVDPRTKGQIAAYRFAPFFRERSGRRERLLSLDDVGGPIGLRLSDRFKTIFPAEEH
jgi:poly-gamma-glutamate synthesis protein (capsule biosynthesis protein)